MALAHTIVRILKILVSLLAAAAAASLVVAANERIALR